MTSIFEITGWSQVGSFMVWTLAVCALAKAIFGSFLAAELQYRFALHEQPKRQRMQRLNWEVNNGHRWNDAVARGSPDAAKVPLADFELAAKRRELQGAARQSFVQRAGTYFMGCFACQTFWTAALIYAATAGVGDVGALFFSAIGYSGAAAMASGIYQTHLRPATGASRGKSGCQGCGS